jgi:GTP cyclohydrolase III
VRVYSFKTNLFCKFLEAVPQFLGSDNPVALTSSQKEKIQKVVDHIKTNYPADYEVLKKQYDPTDAAEAKLEKA